MEDKKTDEYIEVVPIGMDANDERRRHIFIKKEDLEHMRYGIPSEINLYLRIQTGYEEYDYVDMKTCVPPNNLVLVEGDNSIMLEYYLRKRYEAKVRRTADVLNELRIISELFGIPIVTASQVADKELDEKYIKLIHHDNWRVVEVYVLKNEISLGIDDHKMHGTFHFEVPGYVKEDGCFTEKYSVNFIMTNWKLAGVEIKPFEEKDPIPTVRVQLKNAIIREESLIRYGYVSKEELDKIFEKYDEKDLNRYPVVDADKYPMIDVFEDIYGRVPLATKPIRDLKIDIEYRVKDAITYIDKLMDERKDD